MRVQQQKIQKAYNSNHKVVLCKMAVSFKSAITNNHRKSSFSAIGYSHVLDQTEIIQQNSEGQTQATKHIGYQG